MTRDEIAALKQALSEARLEAMATRVGLMAVMQRQWDRTDLFLAFDALAAQSVAAMPSEYPAALVDHFRRELDRLREFVQGIPGRSPE